MPTAHRIPVLLVTGLDRVLTGSAVDVLGAAIPGSVVVHHDVRDLGIGVVLRTVAEHGAAGPVVHREVVELAAGALLMRATGIHPEDRTVTAGRVEQSERRRGRRARPGRER